MSGWVVRLRGGPYSIDFVTTMSEMEGRNGDTPTVIVLLVFVDDLHTYFFYLKHINININL